MPRRSGPRGPHAGPRAVPRRRALTPPRAARAGAICARRPSTGLRGGMGVPHSTTRAQARTERRARHATRRSRGGAVDTISRCQVQDRGGVFLTCAVLPHRTTGVDLGDRVDPSGTVRVVREAPIHACRQPRLSATDVQADQCVGRFSATKCRASHCGRRPAVAVGDATERRRRWSVACNRSRACWPRTAGWTSPSPLEAVAVGLSATVPSPPGGPVGWRGKVSAD